MYIDVTMEMKSEADSNDINESSHDDKPSVGMFVVFLMLYSLLSFLCVSLSCFPVVLMCSVYVFHQHITLATVTEVSFDSIGSYFCVFSYDCHSDCYLYAMDVFECVQVLFCVLYIIQ